MFYVSKKGLGRPSVTIGCKKCGGRSKKNGRRNNRQRYCCVVCKHSFLRQNHSVANFKQFNQFYQLITGEVNRTLLLKQNQQSRKTLSTRFKLFFDKPLFCSEVWEVLPPVGLSSPWIYGIDGKWLRRNGVFILHRNITTKENLYWSFHLSESYMALESDLVKLTELFEGRENYPCGAVSDWKGAIVSSVSCYLGGLPHQRCLTHVTRTLKALLPKRSPFPSTLLLRSIALKLIHIRDQEEVEVWFRYLAYWYDHYGRKLKERTVNEGLNSKTGMYSKRRWWYTHGNLRRAWRLLTNEPETFFKHLDHKLLPHSNNSLEGTISQASNKLINHRGMKPAQQISFLRWYFTFSRVKNKKDLRKLWAYWKTVNNSV